MWVLSVVLLALWIASMEFALPVPVVIFLFAMVVGSAAVAMMPRAQERIEIDRE